MKISLFNKWNGKIVTILLSSFLVLFTFQPSHASVNCISASESVPWQIFSPQSAQIDGNAFETILFAPSLAPTYLQNLQKLGFTYSLNVTSSAELDDRANYYLPSKVVQLRARIGVPEGVSEFTLFPDAKIQSHLIIHALTGYCPEMEFSSPISQNSHFSVPEISQSVLNKSTSGLSENTKTIVIDNWTKKLSNRKITVTLPISGWADELDKGPIPYPALPNFIAKLDWSNCPNVHTSSRQIQALNSLSLINQGEPTSPGYYSLIVDRSGTCDVNIYNVSESDDPGMLYFVGTWNFDFQLPKPQPTVSQTPASNLPSTGAQNNSKIPTKKVAPTYSIRCYKGRSVKIFTGLSVTCPKGWIKK